jgi:hypothetical protein
MVDFEHHSGPSWRKLGHTDFLQKTVIHVECLAHQRGSQLGIAQVEKDARRTGNSLRRKVHVAFNVNRHARVIRCRPVPNAGHSRQATGARCRGLAFRGGSANPLSVVRDRLILINPGGV